MLISRDGTFIADAGLFESPTLIYQDKVMMPDYAFKSPVYRISPVVISRGHV